MLSEEGGGCPVMASLRIYLSLSMIGCMLIGAYLGAAICDALRILVMYGGGSGMLRAMSFPVGWGFFDAGPPMAVVPMPGESRGSDAVGMLGDAGIPASPSIPTEHPGPAAMALGSFDYQSRFSDKHDWISDKKKLG